MADRRRLLIATINETFFNDTVTIAKLYNWLTNSDDDSETTWYRTFGIRNTRATKKCNGFYEQWIHKSIHIDFFVFFRMSYETFSRLLTFVMEHDRVTICKKFCGGNEPVGPEKGLMIFVWYLSKQETLISIGQRFGIGAPTVMKIVNTCLRIFIRWKKYFIFWPSSATEINQISNEFTSYPGAIGALDGSHISIKAPQNDQDSYLSRYHRHTLNLMAICTKKQVFTYVSAGFPGSAHDARVFQNSDFYLNIERYGPQKYFPDRGLHIIGDSAFPCLEWLMTPYKRQNHLTRAQKYHNTCLSADRVVIENAFGKLKGRWRILQYINVYSIKKAVQIIMVCCMLHNFCFHNNDYCEDYYYEDEQEDEEQPYQQNDRGVQKREEIMRMLQRA